MAFEYPSDDYLTRLGRVTISFSDLEWTLGLLYEVILDPSSKVGSIAASHLSFTRLIDVIDSTYAFRWPNCDRRDDLAELLRRAQDAEVERNRFAHSSYGFPDGSPDELLTRTKTTAKRKRGLRTTSEELSTAEIDRYLNGLVDVVSDISDFVFWVYRTHHENRSEQDADRKPENVAS